MLTKWGAALGLASAGRVVAGGGGVLGDATVWPTVLDWTALGTIAGPLRSGDLAPVGDLGPAGSFGLAQYNGTDWELRQAVFATVADLLAFGGGGELIGSGAIATVGTGIETDPAYFYDGAQWLRMPDGVHYIWQQRSDWLDLGTIPAPQNNDRVFVQTLGTAHSSGFAERHGGTWKLVQGRFATVADMVAFPEPIEAGAFAEVKSGGGHDDDSVTYVYQSGAWVRYAALTAGFAWVLTETQLLEGTDPSGIGAVQDGDYGTYTPAGGAPIVVRFKASCPAPGGNRPVWMIPEAYAGSPQVVAWLTGSEGGVLATTLAAQGWTVTTTGSGASQGTVTLNSGYVRCFTPAGTGGTAQVITPTWLGSQRFCVQGLMRGSAAGSDPYVGLLQVNNNDIQYTFMRGNLSGVFRHFTFSAAPAWTTVDSLNSLPNNGATPGYNLDASTPWFFQAIGRELTSATVSETVETRINGELYGSMRRNLDSAVAGSAMNLSFYANGGASGTTSTLELKTLTVLTY